MSKEKIMQGYRDELASMEADAPRVGGIRREMLATCLGAFALRLRNTLWTAADARDEGLALAARADGIERALRRERPEIVEEEYGDEGPTGRWREVLAAVLMDAGDNEHAIVYSAAELGKVNRPHGLATRWVGAVEGRVVTDQELRSAPVMLTGALVSRW